MDKALRYIVDNYVLFIALFLFTIAKLFFLETGFFWDSISTISVPANYLYEHGLFHLFYPKDVNIPIPGFSDSYVALVWKLTHRSLWVTHLAFLPAIYMLVYQIYVLCKRYVPLKYLSFVFFLLLVDPTLVTQSLLLTSDLFLMLFAVWTINNSLSNKKMPLCVSLFLLAFVSERGMIVSFALMAFHVVNVWLLNEKDLKKTISDLSFVFIPTFLFYCYAIAVRKIQFGYFFLDQSLDSSWGEHWQVLNLVGFFRNVVLLMLRFIDFGRVFLWIAFIYLLFRRKRKGQPRRESVLLIILFLSLFLAMAFVTLPFVNPFGHRYFTLHYLVFAMFLALFIIHNVKTSFIKPLFTVLIVALLTGNAWLFPERMAQGWDASLIHYPYHELRKEVVAYLDGEGIDVLTVGVGFPMTSRFSLVDLGVDDRQYAAIDLKRNKWVLYSQINNFDDATIDAIKGQTLVKKFKKGAVYINLYKVNNSPN